MNKIIEQYKKPILLFLFVVGLILTWWLTSVYLNTHFLDSGEAYHKGAGHLLPEDFDAAIGFLIARFCLMSFFAFNLLFVLTAHKPLLKFLNYTAIAALALLLVFVLIKTSSSDFLNQHHQRYRLIQQVTIGLSFLVGYFLARLGKWIANVLVAEK